MSTPSLAAGRRLAPDRLVLVRHGQSMGNVADERAQAGGLPRLALETRDADTPLSDTGRQQAEALGRRLAAVPVEQHPQVVLSSPYLRAHETARIALESAGLEHRLVVDERLRERDLGVIDGWTRRGIEERYPDEAERRQRVGKFYYRPAGGESWCDVALRVRSLLADIRSEYDGEQVWVFCHQAVIMGFRLVLERMDEEAILEVDRTTPLPNCSLTSYARDDDGALVLESYADTGHVGAGSETTETPRGAEG